MKVQNTTIFMGDSSRSERHGNSKAEEKNRSTIYAGNLNQNFDPIVQKRKQAQKQAMKIITDAWAGDQEIDNDLEERRNKVIKLRGEANEAKEALKNIEEDRAALRETYGVEEDSQEEQDLKLLEKEIDARTPGKKVVLSEEEMEKIEQIKANGLTEYQSRSLEMKEAGTYYENQIYNCETEIEMENAIVRGTKLERLKKSPMLEAQKQADGIMEAASQEIIGMLVDEAKEHIDEEMEEKKEAAEKKAEEKEELEEKLEKTKEEKEEQEEFTEEILETTEQMTELSSDQTDIQKEIQDIMNKMKLLEEDIKGAAVDETV